MPGDFAGSPKIPLQRPPHSSVIPGMTPGTWNVARTTRLTLCAVIFMSAACARFDADGSYLGLLLIGGSSGGGGSVASVLPWASSQYQYRRKIVFGTAHTALEQYHTVMLTVDTRTSSTNVSLASGNDVRVYLQKTDGTATELDRYGYNWNTAATQIDFRLPEALAANLNEPTDGSYYLYYGNAAAGTPPATEMNVYWFADFFDRADSSTLGGSWTEWSAASADPAIVSGRLELDGNNGIWESGGRHDFPLGSLTRDFELAFDWRIVGNAEAIWCYSLNIGNGATMVDNDATTGVGVGLYFGEGNAGAQFSPNNTYNMDYDLNTTANQLESGIITDASGYTVIAVRVLADVGASTFDYYRDTTLRRAGNSFVNAGATLSRIRMGESEYNGTQPAMAYDNVKIFYRVADDPEMAVQSEETE